MGDKEVEYNQEFRLLLQTKLANPHYKPEMQAQTTLINFTVTRDGLEDQLLAEVVKAERPDLEQLKVYFYEFKVVNLIECYLLTSTYCQQAELTKQQNDFKIMLKKLEDDLLSRLSSAGGTVKKLKVVYINVHECVDYYFLDSERNKERIIFTKMFFSFFFPVINRKGSRTVPIFTYNLSKDRNDLTYMVLYWKHILKFCLFFCYEQNELILTVT